MEHTENNVHILPTRRARLADLAERGVHDPAALQKLCDLLLERLEWAPHRRVVGGVRAALILGGEPERETVDFVIKLATAEDREAT
jgi:hypothetical protein